MCRCRTIGFVGFAQPPQQSPQAQKRKKGVKKNLELKNASSKDRKGIEEDLEEEGENEDLTSVVR
jgi:hypothetical protein